MKEGIRSLGVAFSIGLALGCRSTAPSGSGSVDGAESSKGQASSEPAPAAEAPATKTPNSAAAISAITQSLPLYPDAKAKSAPPWPPPGQFAEGKWGTTYEADTSDPMEKVLDWYEKEMRTRGWTGARSFKGMMSFSNQSAPDKLITLASGPDEKAPGQTLIRLLVLDK